MDIGSIIMGHNIDISRMSQAMFEADDVGAIIRCHFEAERAIDYLLRKFTEERFNPKKWRWDFAQKVEILHLIGISEIWLAPIKTLNGHRNAFAHKGQDTFKDQEVIDLYHQVRRILPRVDNSFQVIVRGTHNLEQKFGDCTNRQKYAVLIFLTLGGFASLPEILAKKASE